MGDSRILGMVKFPEKMNKGYLRVTTVAPCIVPGDIEKNKQIIASEIDKHVDQTDILVFPELALTGYSCADMFLSPDFAEKTTEALKWLNQVHVWNHGIIVILGAPYYGSHGRLLNAAFVLGMGSEILAIPKKNLPNYSEFYEKRWFSVPNSEFRESGPTGIKLLQTGVFKVNGALIGVELCEDLWAVNPPSTEQVTEHGAEIIINLSASPRLIGKQDYLKDLVRMTSARLACGYVYVSAGPSESTTDLVFSGYGVASENGVVLSETDYVMFTDQIMTMTYDIDLDVIRGWRRKNKTIDMKPTDPVWKITIQGYTGPVGREYSKHPFLPEDPGTYREIITTMSLGIQKRLESCGQPSAVIGISGGSDSTLALLATVDAVDCLDMPRSMIHAISMPCFGTTQRTKGNAQKLAEALGVTFKEIPIGPVVTEHLKSLEHELDKTDIAYENAQARTRTMTLFNYSNMIGGLVIGTGDLSELALGWCTYGADHLSSYNPNVSIPKTLVIPIIRWVADRHMDKNTGDQVTPLHDVLLDITDTPISPELLPGQQLSEDTVGPYELMDFFLYHFLRAEWSIQKILGIAIKTFQDTYQADFVRDRMLVFLKRFQTQQFKRSCLPDGPKVGSCSLSPRGDWRMPSDMSFDVLIQEIKSYDTTESYL